MKLLNSLFLAFFFVNAQAKCLSDSNYPDVKGLKNLSNFSDEFNDPDGSRTKWDFNNPDWIGRAPSIFSASNVRVDDGFLKLTAKKMPVSFKDQGGYLTAAVKSKSKVLYGVFEVRSKSMLSNVSSSFWLYDRTEKEWTEIDVFETSGFQEKYRKTVFMNLHVFHNAESSKHWSSGGRVVLEQAVSDFFHLYTLEWSPTYIRWFVDKCMVLEKKNTDWHQPLYINFDSEVMPEWFGLPDDKEKPSAFLIDYIRAWSIN